jgi:thiamine-monophosphate kinase
VAIDIDLDALPGSPAVLALAADARRCTQATGGDDYELCFTAAPADASAIEAIAAVTATRVTRIGRVRGGRGVHARLADGTAWLPPRAGHVHFA